MGKLFENEMELRKSAKEVRALILEHYDIDKAIEIISNHEEILTYNYGRDRYLTLLPTVRYEKGLKDKYHYLEKIIHAGFQLYENKQDYEELVFFAAAKCDVKNLRSCMEKIPKENRNKTKEGDTILLFLVKYGNLENSSYLETLDILVNEYKLNVNKADYKNHSAIIILLSKYVSLQTKGIVKYNDIILNAVGIILTRNDVDLLSHKIDDRTANDIIQSYKLKDILYERRKKRHHTQIKSEVEDAKSILFTLLSEKKEEEFLKKISELEILEENVYDSEDGNSTLLQLACEKNLKQVVKHLLKKGVDISRVTKRNRKTPLEIAARRNYYPIFMDILNENKLVVDSDLFTTFVLNRGRQIKTRYFDEILCYDQLQLDISYKNGNTPLHYAIIFSNSEAVLKMLKRGASLSVKNKNGKDPLDFITKQDLELYMDQCILLDRHNKLFDKNYELRFDFSGFIEKDKETDKVVSEIEIASKICSSERLKSLAKHPLMMAFIELKWNLISSFFNNLVLLYIFFIICSFILSSCVGHVTSYILNTSLLIVCTILITSLFIICTIQPSMKMASLRSQDALSFSLHVICTVLVYYFFKNIHFSLLFFELILFFRFLQQHLYFSKYQALIVTSFRYITPYVLTLFALHYFTDFENILKQPQLNLVLLLMVIYILVITHSFSVLADSISDIEYSLKVIYNRNSLNFIKFYENIYSLFYSFLENPFVYETCENVSRNKIGKKLFLNFYLSKNKFVNEKLHLVKLDSLTVKKVQDFVVRVNEKGSK